MKFQIQELLYILPVLSLLSCQTENTPVKKEQVAVETKMEETEGNILDTFSIPYHKYNKFKKLRTADEYFQSACDRYDERCDSVVSLICIREYQECIKLDSAYWYAYRNMARSFLRIGKPELAYKSINLAVKFCANAEDAAGLFDLRGKILYDRKDYAGAVKDFERLIDVGMSPLDYNYYWFARSTLKSGQKEKAQQIIKEAKAKDVDFTGYNLSEFE